MFWSVSLCLSESTWLTSEAQFSRALPLSVLGLRRRGLTPAVVCVVTVDCAALPNMQISVVCVCVVCVLAIEASSLGRPDEPCVAPLQWEGRTVQYDHSTGRNTRAAVAYDAQNQRIRVLEQKTGHTPCKKFFEYIYLFESGVYFQIEQVTKACAKLNLTEAWDPYDIPMNSTYEDQYFIGGPGDMIEVQEWSDRKHARKDETWVGVYTLKDCYPVHETYTKNSSVTTTTRFFDLELGISDPEVFTPPSSCMSALPEHMTPDC